MPTPTLHDTAVNRWVHLVTGVLAMMALADAQFVACALARLPDQPVGAAVEAVRNALGVFIIAETVFVPIERQLLDWARPKVLLSGVGGCLSVVSWFLSMSAGGPATLLLGGLLGGVGAGLFYAGTVARSLVRFTEHRGRCLVGVAMACAAVAVPAALPGVGALRLPTAPALLPWNVAQSAVILLAALYVVKPLPADWEPPDD
jgi:hypothetical protein